MKVIVLATLALMFRRKRLSSEVVTECNYS